MSSQVISLEMMNWVCSQIGSREHYAIPRILQKEGKLNFLLTDFWSQDYPYFRHMPIQSFKKMGERWHPELTDTSVLHLGMSRLIFEVKSKVHQQSEWDTIVTRNNWYQKKMLKLTEKKLHDMKPGIFFSYSYSALHIARRFKEMGWKIVIGQIDPGKLEEDLVATEEEKFIEFKSHQKRAPAIYWEMWNEEMTLSDLILVNSDWSKEALLKQQIPEAKIRIVPLAFAAKKKSQPPRSYPTAFSENRPLRVLFLGQVNLRKGVHYLVKAMEKLKSFPIVLDFVGPCYVDFPDQFNNLAINFHGPVSRSTAETYYSEADIFILPTLSDGFAITQLEAMGKGLPLIVAKNCARLVEHQKNGYLLENVSEETIINALKYCAENPKELATWSKNSQIPETYSMDSLGAKLFRTTADLLL